MINTNYSFMSQVLQTTRANEGKEYFTSLDEFQNDIMIRGGLKNTSDEVGVLNRPLGKEIEKLSSDVIKEMSEDGNSLFEMKQSFTANTLLDANFESSSFVVKNPDYLENSVKGNSNSEEYFNKRFLDTDAYKNFEPLEVVYQSTTFMGATDKMSRFSEVLSYGMLNGATEKELANKDFQLEAQNFFNQFYESLDIISQAYDESSHINHIAGKIPRHETILTTYEGYSKEEFEIKKQKIIKDIDPFNPRNKKTKQEEIESLHKFFNPTLEEVQKNATGEGVYASKEFDSISDVLDFIKEKKEYLKEHPNHLEGNRNKIELDFLTRLEEKLMEDISTVSMKSDVKFENGQILGQLYG